MILDANFALLMIEMDGFVHGEGSSSNSSNSEEFHVRVYRVGIERSVTRDHPPDVPRIYIQDQGKAS